MWIWSNHDDESEWYEKAKKLLSKHRYLSVFNSNIWDATLNMIFGDLCERACDESWDDDFITCLENLDYDFLESADERQVGLTKDEIDQYMTENEIDVLTQNDFKEMREYYYDEIKEKLTDILYSEYLGCKKLFVKALKNEYGKSTIEKLLFFYVRESRHSDALAMYDGSGDLWSLSEEEDDDDAWADEEVDREEDHVSIDQSNELPILNMEPELKKEPILYSFVECSAIVYPNIDMVFDWIDNDLN